MSRVYPNTPERRELLRDRATVRAEVKVLSNPQASQAEKTRAVEAISSTVLKGTGQSATAETPAMLANLTAELVDSGTVGNLSIAEAASLKTSPEVAATIPATVLKRLDALV